MLYRNASIFAFACVLGATAGCRDNGTLKPADLSMAGGGGGGTGGGMDMAMATTNYTVATIAVMRGGAPGAYELDDVVAIGLTPSAKSPKIFVQDAAGGDFSAVRANCSSTSTAHPCTVASTVATVALGHKVTIKGTYIKSTKAEGSAENFYIDSITDNGAGTAPQPTTVMLADVQQSAVADALTTIPANKKYWFQHVTVMTPGTMVVYDLSPTELVYSGATACSYQLGFSLIPMGTAGVMTAAACTGSGSTATQPTAVATPDPARVLIGTDFYKTFVVSSDCKCAAMFSDTQVTPAMTTTKLDGILVYDTVFGSSPVVPYQYLAPLATTDLGLQ